MPTQEPLEEPRWEDEMSTYRRYPTWIKFGVWACLLGLGAFVILSVVAGF
jgi:hypothetical protein